MPKRKASSTEHDKLNARSIRVLRLELGEAVALNGDLSAFGIHIVGAHRDLPALLLAAQSERVDVVVVAVDELVGLPPGPGSDSWGRTSAAGPLGTCVVCSTRPASLTNVCDQGYDALAFADQPPEVMAVAMFAAYNAAVLRRKLGARVVELETELQNRRVVDQAKAILARQSDCSEREALSRMRKEARDKRRPLWELAQAIVDAGNLIPAKKRRGRDGPPKPPEEPGDT
jgi:AmiR/NasT family two-component response regulator